MEGNILQNPGFLYKNPAARQGCQETRRETGKDQK